MSCGKSARVRKETRKRFVGLYWIRACESLFGSSYRKTSNENERVGVRVGIVSLVRRVASIGPRRAYFRLADFLPVKRVTLLVLVLVARKKACG